MKSKIAILCIAHTIDENFRLLMNHLLTDFDIFVHFDKKNEGKFKNKIEDFKKKGIHFVQDNIRVYWGGNSQIIAEYKLFCTASEYSDYSHYLLISGVDFPIKSNQEIINFFEKNRDKTYMEFVKLPSSNWDWNGGLDRVQRYWLTEFDNRFYTKLFGRLLLMIQKILFIKRKSYFKEYYGGANWGNFSESAVKFILNYVKENPEVLESFKYTRAADEIWKQTILNLSDEEIIYDSLRFIDWVSGPTYPKVLDENDFDALAHSSALFARKMSGYDTRLQKLLLKPFVSKDK